jgi:delta 1-pyrroline-5-carboxylate dehydrogenase
MASRIVRAIRFGRLKARLRSVYTFGRRFQSTLADAIYEQRADTWRAVMGEQLRGAGSGRAGSGPSGGDARYLRRLSSSDAQSIRATFNRELANAVDRIVDANPAQTREFYQRELNAWARERRAYKERQIANMNRATARSYAQERFEDENDVLTNARYVFVGPPPREPVCADLMQRGEVSRDVMEANRTPIHINCPHSWERTDAGIGRDLDSVWTGG